MKKINIPGQTSLFNWQAGQQDRKEPNVGDFIRECGAAIPRIMRTGYIDQKVCYDISSEHNKPLYKVGILEEIIPYHDKERAIIYTGVKQRTLLTFYPGIEIYEIFPWSWEERKENYEIQKQFRNQSYESFGKEDGAGT